VLVAYRALMELAARAADRELDWDAFVFSADADGDAVAAQLGH
jgi:hypothetical protein